MSDSDETHDDNDSRKGHVKGRLAERMEMQQRLTTDKIVMGVVSFIFISVAGWVGTSVNALTTKVTELSVIVQHQKEDGDSRRISAEAMNNAFTDMKVKIALFDEKLKECQNQIQKLQTK